MKEFTKLGLSNETIKALIKKGFKKPTTVQEQVIPLLLKGKKDIVAQSQTGTGKTASFGLPIIEKLKTHSKTVRAIILTPTRELAIQVSEEIDSLKGAHDLKILPIYGGAPIGAQMDKLKKGIDIVVGTPGRIMDLQRRGKLKIDRVEFFVLDEADEMLNMGFVEDIESILETAPKEKSMLLFSATMPKLILKIAKKYMREYDLVEIEKSQVITSTVEQVYYDINAKDRFEGLRRIIDYYVDFYGIIFCNTKSSVDTITQKLVKLNYKAASLHGDITQSQREKILQQFRDKNVKILIATDVAARGIDVNDLTHVINFSLPQSPESYVHRIGRTGRAGKKGISVTFVIPSERKKLNFVEKVNNCTLIKKELPTAKQIVEHKESQMKTIIQNIIEGNSNKSNKNAKFELIAQELLNNYDAKKIISAILKYSFKNKLENNYKDISYDPSEKSSEGRRGGRRGFSRRGRDSGSRGNSRGGNRSRERSDSRSNNRSGFSRRTGGSDRSRSSDKPRSDRKDKSNRSKKTTFKHKGKIRDR